MKFSILIIYKYLAIDNSSIFGCFIIYYRIESKIQENQLGEEENKQIHISLFSIILGTYKTEWIIMVLYSVITELFVWINLFVIKFFIDWIKEDGSFVRGIMMALLFWVTMFFSIFFKIYYYMYGNKLAITINRGISLLLYQKILKLSQKSLVLASTGKLVTLVSGELQSLEKTFWYITYLIASPVALLACFIYFSYIYWEAGAIAFVWIWCMLAAFVWLALKNRMWRYMEGKFLQILFILLVTSLVILIV